MDYATESSGDSQDGGAPADPIVKHCERIIARYEKEFQPWHTRCDKILKIYTEQRKTGNRRTHQKRMSLLWSNMNVLQPAVYARMPLPSVSRRFRDADPVARMGSEMLERCLSYSFDVACFDTVMRQVRDDYLLVARGTAWVRYEVETEAIPGPDGQPVEIDGQPAERIQDERICWDYVHWRDFGHNVARCWAEVTEVWRRSFLDKEQIKARFKELSDKDIAAIPFDHKPEHTEAQTEANTQAVVYEIWCKPKRKVYWIVRGFHKPLEVSDPPLNFRDFFPCPKPAYGTLSPASLVPVPDYVFYQDQAEEIDDLTHRINAMTDSLKLVGFYPADADGDLQAAVEKAASPSVENKLVPVKNWAAFAEKGGSQAIQWWPADVAAKVIQACIEVRKQLIDDVYQITGISDIVRGEGEASETATAQQIKTQWGSMRIRDRQTVLAQFARECARLGGEIIAERFQPETLNRMSNLGLPTEEQLQEQMAKAQAVAAQQAQMQAQQQQQPPQAPPGPQPPMPPGAM